MSINKTFNGTSYNIPTTGETGWGTQVSNFLGDVADNALVNIVEDGTPQLGAMLDVNTFGLGDGTNLLLGFAEDAGAVNYIQIENEETGSGPIISAVGSDTNIDLLIQSKGTGTVNVTGNVGIGIATPDGTLHVHTASAGTISAAGTGDDLVVENNTAGGISILTPNNVPGNIFFGDPENSAIGQIKYDHSVDSLTITTNNTVAMTIDSNQNLNVAGDISANNYANKNVIINGNFDIWQRGTSGFGHNIYSADRWVEVTNTDDTLSISRQAFTTGQTDVPNEPEFFLRAALTAGSTGSGNDLRQRVEGVRTFAGETVTLSYYVKASTAYTQSNRFIVQNFGTGGAPSSALFHGLPNIDVTTSWQKFTNTITLTSLNGKTLGTGGNDFVDVILSLAVGTTVDVDIAQVQLEKGSVATEFEHRSIATELAMAQRYFERLDLPSNNNVLASGHAIDGNKFSAAVLFDEKRATPTITFSSLSTWEVLHPNVDIASITVISSDATTKVSAMVSLTKTAAFTQGSGGLIRSTGTAFMDIEAEL